MDTNLPPPGPEQPAGAPQTPPGGFPASTPAPAAAPPILPRAAAAPRNRGWKIAVVILSVLLLLSVLVGFILLASLFVRPPLSTSRHVGPRLEEAILEDHRSENKIAVVSIEGIISSDFFSPGQYSLVDYVRDQFKLAGRDPDVKAVILKVNSPGGEVLAADDIYRIISEFQTKKGKPVVASMGSMAASGGYYVSAPCRWIVANELTLTGSIGVIFHSWNYRGLLDKVGVRPEIYKSGPFKDMLSGDKKESDITPEERRMIQNLIEETFGRFKTVVADGRQWANKQNKANKDNPGKPLSSDWTNYADGRVLSGKEAFEHGFVDELGSFEAAVSRARKLARIDSANLIQYHQIFDLSNLFRLFGKSEPASIKVDVGLNPPKLKAGQLYFLAPTFVQ